MRDARPSEVGKICHGCEKAIQLGDKVARRGRCGPCATEYDRGAKIRLAERKAAGLPARPPTWEQQRAEKVRRMRSLGIFDETPEERRERARLERRTALRAEMRGEDPLHAVMKLHHVEVPDDDPEDYVAPPRVDVPYRQRTEKVVQRAVVKGAEKSQGGKICLGCNKVIGYDDVTARAGRCTPCRRAKQREEYHRNKERIAPKKALHAKRWREQNAEANRARNRIFATAMRRLKDRHIEEFERIYAEMLSEAGLK